VRVIVRVVILGILIVRVVDISLVLDTSVALIVIVFLAGVDTY